MNHRPDGRRHRPRRALPTAPGRDRLLFQAIGLGVIYQAADGTIVDANPAAEQILGLTAERLRGRTSLEPEWHAIWPDGTAVSLEDRPGRAALRLRRIVGPVEMGFPRTDGSIRWLRATAIPRIVRGAPFNHIACVIFEDITAQKLAEQAIRVSEERVQRLVEANVIGIIVAERQGVIQANDAFLAMVGYDRNELNDGKIDWRAMTPVEFHPLVDAAVQEIADAGGTPPFEKEFVRKDGSRIPVLIGAARLNLDPLRWVSFVVDLTSLKRAQSEVQRQANLLDQAYDAILAWDWNGGITYWNLGAERQYGYSAEEAIGRISHELLRTEPQTSIGDFLAALERDGHAEQEVVHVRRDGRRILVESRHVLVNDPAQPYVVEVNRDITSRAEFERERQSFVDTLAHDLRNPLGAAKAQAQLMIRRAERDVEVNKESLLRGLGSVVGSINRMNGLIGEMLDAGHLREGQPLELQLSNVDLVALARASASSSDRITSLHTLSVESALESLEGRWDASRLERVIGNLLDNAVKYSPAGGDIVISVSREASESRDWAVLAVSDQGLGIPADQLGHVFERFQRGRNVTGRISGAGIGLSGVKQIVEQMGGSISVVSTEGAGSTFTVRLPL